MEAATQTKNVGRIEEIQGVVIEAVFPDELPEINHAITVDRGDGGTLVCEVQQHLGDDRVRAVAMDTTDGLARGTEVAGHRRPDHRARSARRRWAASSTCSASRSTSATPSRPRSAGRSTATPRTSRT